jgi:dTDP-4-amino-4,6-dideoxygalactose transaminase
MRKLPEVIAARRANLAYFAEQLADVSGIQPLPTAPGCDRGGWFRFLVHYRLGVPIDRYLDALHAEGVAEVMPGSAARPLHQLAIFQTRHDRLLRDAPPRRVYRRGDFPNAERFSATTLQFPAFTEPCRELLAQYAEAMRKVARHARELE